MTQKVAESLGFPTPDAVSLGQELAEQATAAAGSEEAPGVALHVRFETSAEALHLHATCAGVTFAISRPLPRA